MVIVYERDGERRERHDQHHRLAAPGPAGRRAVVEAGFLGVAPTMVLEKKDAGFVVVTMGTYTGDGQGSGEMPVKLVGVAPRRARPSRSVPPTGR